MNSDHSNLYMDTGLEFTKKFENSNQLVKVKMHKAAGDFIAKITVVHDNIMTTKITIRLEPQDVNLSVAETLALWAANAPFASSTR